MTWFAFINKITIHELGQIETPVPITFNKTNQWDLLCFISTIVPLFFMKRAIVFYSLVLFLFLASATSYAAEDVVLRHSFAGNLSFELTGNTLRQESNTCRPVSSGRSSGRITLPPGSSIKAAYLYWSGSGSPDNTIRFRNVTSGIATTVNSDVTYLESISNAPFFSAKKDVTSFVSQSNATYEVSNLTFDGSSTYCTNKRAYGGWALAIVYENSNQPLRVINVFDGFKNFWGQSLTLSPNNFVIAQTPASKGGKHAHITWEGDSGNSQSRGGFNESLRFEGINLTDSGNPSSNQFNSFSNVNGDTSGVDIDAYNIGSLLTAGDTSVTTTYSSGQDRVFLTAEIISVPNEPVAELSIQQSGPTNLLRGEENTIDFTVTNNGPNTELPGSEFNLSMPLGFTYVPTANPLWNCSVTNNDLKCFYSNEILKDNSVSLPITFTINSSLENNDNINLLGTIKGVLFDNILSNNMAISSYIIKTPILSTSTKEVIDLNGGNVNPGDTLRYTITIRETSGFAVNNLSVTDHISSVFSEYTIVSLPANITNNSLTAPAGNFNAGVINIDNISIPANGSQNIVVDAKLVASLLPNTKIDNAASLITSAGSSITISAPTLFSTQAITPAEGNKLLYFDSNSSLDRRNQIMKRNRPSDSDFSNIPRNNRDGIWTLTPSFQSPFEFNGSNINLRLCLQSNQNNRIFHRLRIELLRNSEVIANSGTLQGTIPSSSSTPGQYTLSIPLSNVSPAIIGAGETLKLRIINITGEGGIRVYSKVGNNFCYVSVPAKTVINVDSIAVMDDGNTSINETGAGSTISIKAVVSDPFGSFDISSADISATDANGNSAFSNENMTVVNDSGASTKTFSYDYTIPENAQIGYWKFSVNTKEGEENTINHRSEFMLLVTQPLPNIKVEKTVEVYSDPVHGTNTATKFSKALPGAILTYTVSAKNTGNGTAQNNSIWISDAIPDNTYMLVKNYDDVNGQGPIKDETANTANGLNYTFGGLNNQTDDIEFSNTNGTNFNYSPVEDSEGLDKNITHFRINPKGIFQAPAAGESPIQFTIKFRVQLQ